VIVVSRIGNSQSDLDAYSDTLKANIRYAQSRAMNSDMVWGITYNGTGYFLFNYDGNAQTVIRLPGEENNVVNLSGAGISLGTFASVSFNSWGSPFKNTTGTGNSEEIDITVSSGSIPPNTFKIIKNTGFIH